MSGPEAGTLDDPLRDAARRRPGAPAVAWPGGHWSYRELDLRVDEAAGRLRSLGVSPGGRVALVLRTGPDAVSLLHGASRAGAVPVPLSPRLTPDELAEALEALGPALVICEAATAGTAGRAADRAGVPLRRVGGGPGDPESFEDADPRDGPSAWPAEGELRAVVWTSGTSGRPRGVLLGEGAFAASAAGARERLDLSPDDRWYAALPVAHVGGLALVDRAARVGSAVVAGEGFGADAFLALADAGGITHASLVPVMLRRALDARGDAPPPEALRCVLVGGARAPGGLVERALERGWPLALTYGMTETCSQAATAPPELVRVKPDSVGPPVPGVEIRIGPDGEIRVRGPTLARSYLGGEPLELDGEGWLRTGDLGELDAEGHLRVTGRRSRRIVSGGVNVDPVEVEEVLRGAPGVEDAVVVGLPDPEWGERVSAALVSRSDARPPDREGVEAHARRRLSGPKRPRTIVFVDALPRNRNGKVDRQAVAALLAGAEGSGGEPPGRPLP